MINILGHENKNTKGRTIHITRCDPGHNISFKTYEILLRDDMLWNCYLLHLGKKRRFYQACVYASEDGTDIYLYVYFRLFSLTEEFFFN